MKKRRTFDIDLPEDDTPAGPAPEVFGGLRRSPMAAAITENAEALRARREIEAQIRAENDALAAEHVRMKQLGLIVDLVPLELIDSQKLVRDRATGQDDEIEELVASIEAIGLSNPIRVEAREDGSYELIQGFRRLSAWRELLARSGDAARWGKIPAGILPRGESVETLYRRMVDENLVRKDISFAEMAMLALNYAADPGTAQNDPDRVVAEVFQSAGYQKRSYIRQFIRLMSRLGPDLAHAPQLPRALGLKLATRLDERPELVETIRQQLALMPQRNAADELAVLRRAAEDDAPTASTPKPAAPPASTSAKQSFTLTSRHGQARCSASKGKLEIRLDRDFASIDASRLESAIADMLRAIED